LIRRQTKGRIVALSSAPPGSGTTSKALGLGANAVMAMKPESGPADPAAVSSRVLMAVIRALLELGAPDAS
jgi:hypothetical protein